MADLPPIPLVGDEIDPHSPRPDRTDRAESEPAADRRPRPRVSRSPILSVLILFLIAGGHGLAIWKGVGGLEGINNGWPIWRDDHPLYYHSALVTRAFLAQSWTTAGYDPWFMAGYPKSVVFPASSTLPEVVIALFGGAHPERVYKLYVLLAAAAIPWLVAAAAWIWGLRASGVTLAVALYLLYVWTDFPINYATFGMLPYLLAVPLALLATGCFAAFLDRGGWSRWLVAALLLSLSVLVHFTTAMLVVPAAAMAYVAGFRTRGNEQGLPLARHLGVWGIPTVVLAMNAFWWLPGIWLAGTKGVSDFAFAHSSEGILARLLQIATVEAEMQSVLIGVGLPGLLLLARQGRVRGAALGTFCLAGFFWGYLAGGFQRLDFLQPGRHTYAFYTGLSIAGGMCLDAVFLGLRGQAGSIRLDRWALAAILLVGFRTQGGTLKESLRSRLWGPEPFLSSRPSPRLLWVVDQVKAHVKPGERLLYEEGGKGIPGVPDPFQRGRFSGLLPERTGVELLGGPYLHAALTTNFTQFGEGALFGKTDWGREHFLEYARIYRPAAILCWSPHARSFCRSNPDLVEIVEDDGTILIGKIRGQGGDVIVGGGRVEAYDGGLRVSDLVPGVDGLVVLRYHSVPYLRARPAMPIEPRLEAGDPVPFIGLRPPSGTTEVELDMTTPGLAPLVTGRRSGVPRSVHGGARLSSRPAWLSPGREYAVLEIASRPSQPLRRFAPLVFWLLWVSVVLVAAAFYYPKAADHRSAFVRWRPQVQRFWDGVNIYDKMLFPNPPILPITLGPLMALPPVAGAMAWFAIKVVLATIALLLCLRIVQPDGEPFPPFFQSAVLLLSLRPILGDLHHGNINLLILFLIVGMFEAWRRGYDILAGVLLGLAISYKVTPALFVPYFAYKRSWRTVGGTVLGLGLFLLVIPSLLVGPRFNFECLSMWWHRMLTPFLVEGSSSPQEINQSMVGVLTRLLTEIQPGTSRYDLHLDVNLVSWPPQVVAYLIKGLTLALLGALAYFCRTPTTNRRDPRFLGEVALVVLTMLFISERSWKHHFVTLVIPYTYLVWELYTPSRSPWRRPLIGGALAASFILMASTSTELGGLFAEGKGHEIAQGYGMFLWAAVVLYAAVAWRMRSRLDLSAIHAFWRRSPSTPALPELGGGMPSGDLIKSAG